MDDLDSFDHYPHGHNYSYSLPVSHDGALPQQIVTPPTRVDSGLRDHSVYASPLAQDVWSFDQDVDAFLNGQGTIDPALLQYNPQIPPRIPLASAPSSAVTSLSAWAGTDATSPPTSPEYLGNNVEDDSCALSEAELSELARLINDGALPDNDSEANLEDLFTPNKDQLSCAGVGHEQALPQHPGAVMANAHGHEPGIQTMIVVDTSPPPGTSRPPRKQSTDKKHPCPVEGCNRKMARRSNIKEHVAKVHLKQRPFLCSVPGCPKAINGKGYCRKENRDDHVRMKHPNILMPPKKTKKSRQGPESPRDGRDAKG